MAKDWAGKSSCCTASLRCGRRPCAAWQGPRSIARLGRTVVTYRACFRWSLVVPGAGMGLDPACLSPGGGSGPGGAGVSEPLRPKPALPTGTVALSLPDDPAADAASA
ncbi:hypothetical protein ACWCQW_25675 [Streptomyces mirabilis]